VSLFGPKKAFRPLTIAEAVKGDDDLSKHLSAPSTKCLEVTGIDSTGRSIVVFHVSKMDTISLSREDKCRLLWYVFHKVLADNEVSQKKGIVLMSNPTHAKLYQFDREFMKMCIESLRGCLPVRLSVIHVCRPPIFLPIIFPIIQVLLGARLRQRVHFHRGNVVQSLDHYGVPKTAIPHELGGDHDMPSSS
jgi:hypothetical protein